MLHTQRTRLFPKPAKSAIFGILVKGGRMKIFWKAEILEMSESDIPYVKCGADPDGAMGRWLRP